MSKHVLVTLEPQKGQSGVNLNRFELGKKFHDFSVKYGLGVCVLLPSKIQL